MTPCYYCEKNRKVACRACIHSDDGPEVAQVIAWRAAPPPAADAVSEAMTDAGMRAWYGTPEWRDTCKWSDSELARMRAAIAAALAARGK